VSSRRVLVGLDRSLDRLTPRGGQAARQAFVQAGAPAGEHLRDGPQPCGDVPPVLVTPAGEQVYAVADIAEEAERGAQVTQRLTRVIWGQLGLQSLAEMRGGQPVALRRDRHVAELGQGAGHQVRPGL
jgi:hypothetical protein